MIIVITDDGLHFQHIGLNFQKKNLKSWPNLLKFFVAITPLIIGNILNIRTMWMEEMELRQTIINACHIVGTFMVWFFFLFIMCSKSDKNLLWRWKCNASADVSLPKLFVCNLSNCFSWIFDIWLESNVGLVFCYQNFDIIIKKKWNF